MILAITLNALTTIFLSSLFKALTVMPVKKEKKTACKRCPDTRPCSAFPGIASNIISAIVVPGEDMDVAVSFNPNAFKSTPIPGFTIAATISPTTIAIELVARNAATDLIERRDNEDESLIPVIPTTTETKISGTMIILINFIKMSPMGLKTAASFPNNTPTTIPRNKPIVTFCQNSLLCQNVQVVLKIFIDTPYWFILMTSSY